MFDYKGLDLEELKDKYDTLNLASDTFYEFLNYLYDYFKDTNDGEKFYQLTKSIDGLLDDEFDKLIEAQKYHESLIGEEND